MRPLRIAGRILPDLALSTVLAVILPAVSVDAVAFEPQSEISALSRGRALLLDGRLTEAIDLYEEAIRLSPLDEELRLALAEVFLWSGLTADAESVLLDAIVEMPDSQLLHYRLADLYANSGRAKRSLDAFTRAGELRGAVPQDTIYMRIGNVFTALLQSESALSAYRRALEINPRSVEVRLGLGNLYFRNGNLDEALAEFTRLAASDPGVLAVHYRLAEVSLRMDMFSASVSAARRALQIDPGHWKSRYLLGRALVRMGRVEEGQSELEAYRRLENEAQARAHLEAELTSFNGGAIALLRQGRSEEAVALLEKGIASHPDHRTLYLSLALTKSQLGRHAGAVETYQTMIRIGLGDDAVVHRNLAREYEAVGNVEASREHQAIAAAFDEVRAQARPD